MLNLIKRTSLFVIGIILISSLAFAQEELKMSDVDEKVSDDPAGIKSDDGVLYGKDYDPSMTVIEFTDLISNPSDYDGKTILVTGSIADVCQKMGCWMIMSDGSSTARVVTGHNFFLPKNAAGNKAVVIGTFKITEISEEEAKHYNEESKNPGKTEDINGPQKVFEIDATGIKILNPVADSNQD